MAIHMVVDVSSSLPDDDLRAITSMACEAARLVVAMRDKGLRVQHKEDGSPVTDADTAAQQLIDDQLRGVSSYPVIGEEHTAHRKTPHTFWLVDPIDGTRDFIKGDNCFTVNIALIEKSFPVMGVVIAPLFEGGLCYAGRVGVGAFVSRRWQKFSAITTREPSDELVAAISHWQKDDESLQNYLAQNNVRHRRSIGSSLKFGWVAEGVVDLYPRLTPTMEWDTAAGDAIVRAASGMVSDMNGAPLAYGKDGYRNEAFVARGALTS